MYDDMPIFAHLHQGLSNRFARGALTAVANAPGEIYNPLWIYGPSGTGKTALLEATAAALRDHPSRPLILRIQAEQLAHDMVCAILHHTTEDFHARILSFHVIIVDHADYLSCKSSTQSEVGQLLAWAVTQGTQVVLISTCAPEELEDLDRLLQEHCTWLLRCSIQFPPPEERLTIVQRMAHENALPLSDQMVCRICDATRSPAQIRCVIHHLTARRKLLQLEDDALSDALDHLLEREVAV